MTRLQKFGGSGQVFSLDVLFSLLPMMMIIGASLQYLYLAEEQSATITETVRLENFAQALSGGVMSQNAQYVTEGSCPSLVAAVQNAASFLGSGYAYHVQAYDYAPVLDMSSPRLCIEASDILWSNGLNPESFRIVNNTASSDLRFVPVYNSSGNLLPGHIAGISFTIWKNN